MCNSSISFYQFSPLSNKDSPAPLAPQLNSTQLYITLQFVVYLLKDMQISQPPALSTPRPFPGFSLRCRFSYATTRRLFFILTDWHMSVCACVWECKCVGVCVPTVMGVAVCSANVAAAIAVAFCNCNSILTIFQLCYWRDWRFDDWWFVAASGQGNIPSAPCSQFQLA